MKKAKHLLGFLALTAFGLFLFPNNVDAAKIESSNDLKIVFEAHDATVDGKTVKLNKNIEDTEIYEIGGDDYVIDLNGYKFTTEKIYIKTGTLTINDSKGNSEIDTTGDCFNVESGAKLIINNSKIDYLVNAGNTIINNANIEDLTNEGTMTIKTGTFDNLNQKGTSLTINGGTFGSTIVELDKGKTTISNDIKIERSNTMFSLKLISGTELSEEAINQILGEGFIAIVEQDYTNNRKIEDEEYASGWRYELSYDDTEIYIIKEETEIMEEILNKIAPNGVLTINGIKSDDISGLVNYILDELNLSSKYNARIYLKENEANNLDAIPLHIEYIKKPDVSLKQKNVKIVFNEPSDEIKASVNSVLSKIENKLGDFALGDSNMTNFVLEDLYLINYLNASTKGMDDSLQLNFAKDLIELINGANLSYKYKPMMGGGMDGFFEMSAGAVYVRYDGIIMGETYMALDTNKIIYVPSNTANTDEARIAAALKRIEDYLGTTKGITITVGGTLESMGYHDDSNSSGTNYYNLTINGKTYKFLICMKDEKDLETPSYLASDVLTNISIESNSTEIPLDAAITVKTITSDEIKKVLGTSIYAAYDISLYSNAKQVNITKLENGKFTVNIPVSENLKGKDIIVYYINSKGKKEPYTATLSADGKSVSFETNHFSTYALVEKVTEENPQTFDGISNGMLIGVISFIGFFGAVIYFNKRNKITSH